MALVTTVLLTVLAATIVLAIAAESVSATRAESTRSDAASATRIAADAKSAFASSLQADPYFYFKTVFDVTAPSGTVYAELARTCTNSTTTTTVQPGAAWSSALANGCTSWTYGATQSPTTWSGATGAAWLEVVPPTTAKPLLQVDIMATSGADSDGLKLTYRLSGSERYTLWSSADLVLDNMARGCAASTTCASLSGTSYSGGAVFLPTTGSVSIASAELATEVGFTPTPTVTSARYYQPTASAGPPPIRKIRNLLPTPLTTSSLRAAQPRTLALACPGGTGAAAAVDALNSSSDGSSTSLCLTAGQTNRLTTATTATVPTGVDGYLLVFTGATTASGGATVTVYVSTATIAPAGNCAVACDLATLGASDLTASPITAPGDINFWNGTAGNGNSLLGTFPLPRTGLIFADKDVYLGACSSTSAPTAYLTANTACPALSAGYGSTPGMVVPSSTTVIAGTSTTPANIYPATSIITPTGVSFGAVAAGSVLFPYWARSPGTTAAASQTVDGAYTALGYGVDTGSSPIGTFPTSVDTTNADNVATALTVNGSLAAPALDLRLQLFSTVNLASLPLLGTQPPPYFTDFYGAWSLQGAPRLTASAACGSTVRTCLPANRTSYTFP